MPRMTIAKIEICGNRNRKTEKNYSALIPRISCRTTALIRVLLLYLFQFQVKSKDSDIDVELYKKNEK